MTDSSDPRRRRRRSGPNRVAPTIELTAKEIEAAASHEAVDPLAPGTVMPAAEAGAATSAADTGGPENAEGTSAPGEESAGAGTPETPAGAEAPASPLFEGAETRARADAEPAPTGESAGAVGEREPATWDTAASNGPSSPAPLAAADEIRPDPFEAETPRTGAAVPPAGTLDAGGAADPGIQGSRDASRRGAGFGSLAAAGLLGGLVGAGLVYGWQTWRGPAQQSDPRLAQIEQQLGALPRQEALRALEGRLGALETAQAGLPQRVEAAQTLAQRAAARAEEAISRPAPAAPAPAPQDTAAIGELSNRLGALEAQVRESLQGAGAATQALERRLAEQEQTIRAAAQPLERRLAEQEQRLAALARQVAEGGSDATRAGTRVVLAERLGDALREGAPYADVLAGLRRFAPDAEKLAPLEPFAQSGAPSAAALAQSFRPLAERLRRDMRPREEDWTDRLLRMADKIVTVRAVNESDDSGGPATLARIEDALDRGAFGDAAAAWDSLPEPARQVSAEWGQRLKQRAAADAAARAVTADAVAALNQATR